MPALLNSAIILMSIGCPMVLAGDALPGSESLVGVWEAKESSSQETWELRGDGATQTIIRTEGGKVTLRLKCDPGRRECHGTEGGKPADVTTYMIGPALVHLEVNDANLIIRRFVLDGETLMIEARKATGRAAFRITKLVRRADRRQP